MDILSLNTRPANEGAKMQVRHPKTKAPMAGVFITLAGIDSDRYQKATDEAANRRLKDLRAGRGGATAEELRADGIKMLAACTIGWEGLSNPDGTELKFSEEAAHKLYTELPWLREQADEFIGDRSNFFQA